MKKRTLGLAMCGSFCTFSRVLDAFETLDQELYKLVPIMSQASFETDSRFGPAAQFRERLETLCGREIVHTIKEAEPFGPKKLLDALVIMPCTGNTLAKLAEERTALAQSLESLKAQTAEAASSAAKTEFELTAVRSQLREAEDEVLRRTEEHKQVQLLAAAVTENLENIEKELAHLTSRTGGEEGKLQALKAQLQQQTAARSRRS